MRKHRYIRVPREKLFDPVLPSAQQTPYTCGPGVGQAVLSKFGIDVEQDTLAEAMGTTVEGTPVEGLIKGLYAFGVDAEVATGSIEELATKVDSCTSIIICIYAYGYTHWVALVGESRKAWYFADPSSENGLGYILKSEFPQRWYNRIAVSVIGTPHRKAAHTVPLQEIPV